MKLTRDQLALEFIKILLPDINTKNYKEQVIKEAFELADMFILKSKEL